MPKKTSPKLVKRLKRHNRIRQTVRGTAERPRLVIFKSLQNHTAQLIDDDKGVVIAQANDIKVKKGAKLERAKKVGEEIAKAAKAKKIDRCVFDRNGFLYHGRIKAIAEAARENGLTI